MAVSFFQNSNRKVWIKNTSVVTPSQCFGFEDGISLKNIKPILESVQKVQCSEIDLKGKLGKKGYRFFDKASKLTLLSVANSLGISLIDNENHDFDDVGLIVGSDGALDAQYSVTKDAVDAPNLMNPNDYPNRGINVIAGQASLKCELRGESSVVSSGYRSGIDALIAAVRKVSVYSTSYVAASGESISDVRKKRNEWYEQSRNYPKVEGAAGLMLQSREPNNQHKICVDAIGQERVKISHHKESKKSFIESLDYIVGDNVFEINGHDDRLEISIKGEVINVEFDAYGATGLMVFGLLMLSLCGDPADRGHIVYQHSSFDGTISRVAITVDKEK